MTSRAGRLLDAQRVARAQPGEALVGAPLPFRPDPEGAGGRLELDNHALLLELDQDGSQVALEAAPVPGGGSEPQRALELLARDHPLGQLDELVA